MLNLDANPRLQIWLSLWMGEICEGVDGIAGREGAGRLRARG